MVYTNLIVRIWISIGLLQAKNDQTPDGFCCWVLKDILVLSNEMCYKIYNLPGTFSHKNKLRLKQIYMFVLLTFVHL